MRECKICKETKSLDNYYNEKAKTKKYEFMCIPCAKTLHKTYEKTHKGFVMRLYRNMESRVTGIQKLKFHLYEGKELLSRTDFYNWILTDSEFLRLFEDYKNSGYERKLAPSVDRVDSTEGYHLGNMEVITMSENSRRGAVSRFKNLNK